MCVCSGEGLGKVGLWLGKYPSVHEHVTMRKNLQKLQRTRNAPSVGHPCICAFAAPDVEERDQGVYPKNRGLIRRSFSPPFFLLLLLLLPHLPHFHSPSIIEFHRILVVSPFHAGRRSPKLDIVDALKWQTLAMTSRQRHACPCVIYGHLTWTFCS